MRPRLQHRDPVGEAPGVQRVVADQQGGGPRARARGRGSRRACARARPRPGWESGSSNRTRSEPAARARASPTRCCWPPESWCGRRSARAFRPTCSSSPSAAWRRSRPGPVAAAATFSRLLMCGHSAWSWNTMPRPRRSGATQPPRPGSSTVAPLSRMTPPSAASNPATRRSRVVLPEPDPPIRMTISPGWTSRSTSRRTAVPP